jgi:hypothetical protein
MKLRLIAVVLTLASIAVSNCAGALVGFYFTGVVSAVDGDPFRAGITPSTLVTGHALYDPDRPASDPVNCSDCMGYRQSIPGGLTAMFGTTLVQADDYVVQIKNDKRQPNGPTSFVLKDTIAIGFSGDFTPPLQSPMYVAGVPYPGSRFEIDLDAASDTFTDSSLPKSLDATLFTSTFSQLDEDVTDHVPAIFWQSTSLSNFTAGSGDYDANGVVDGDDYAMWRNTFGSTSDCAADGNGNGVIDAADYIVWRMNVSHLATGSVVPEPEIAPLFLPCVVALALFRSKIH